MNSYSHENYSLWKTMHTTYPFGKSIFLLPSLHTTYVLISFTSNVHKHWFNASLWTFLARVSRIYLNSTQTHTKGTNFYIQMYIFYVSFLFLHFSLCTFMHTYLFLWHLKGLWLGYIWSKNFVFVSNSLRLGKYVCIYLVLQEASLCGCISLSGKLTLCKPKITWDKSSWDYVLIIYLYVVWNLIAFDLFWTVSLLTQSRLYGCLIVSSETVFGKNNLTGQLIYKN